MKSSRVPAHPQVSAVFPSLRQLADFRYQLRKFLRFSERAARSNGLTPQQHQLLLGVAGFTGRGWATITELAEFLQERHNAVVGLVQRAKRADLVSKTVSKRDRRFVRIELTPRGSDILRKLTQLHLAQFREVPRLDFMPIENQTPAQKAPRQEKK